MANFEIYRHRETLLDVEWLKEILRSIAIEKIKLDVKLMKRNMIHFTYRYEYKE